MRLLLPLDTRLAWASSFGCASFCRGVPVALDMYLWKVKVDGFGHGPRAQANGIPFSCGGRFENEDR